MYGNDIYGLAEAARSDSDRRERRNVRIWIGCILGAYALYLLTFIAYCRGW